MHHGGPYWAKKDEGAWSVPKGFVNTDEEHFSCALREFTEETGFAVEGSGHDLGIFRQPGGKRLHIWAIAGDCDLSKLKCNRFGLEWPPRSRKIQLFPEVDRGGWFGRSDACRKIVKGQRPIIETFFNTAERPRV